MSLLSWPTALIFAGIALPLLLLLYFLKLRRQIRKVSSTLLWKRAVHDLQVNAPFQRLRKNLLLFLQLLILGAILFAIANPVANFMKNPGENLVLLVDRSGSMKTIEADGRTRLEHARQAAEDRVANLPDDARAMVISFADRSEVVCSFTSDRRRLQRAIEQIEPTDAPTKIGEALQLAVAYSTNLVDVPGTGGPQMAIQGTADIELFSDGRIADAGQEYVTRGKLIYHRVGAARKNVGITAFGARRDYDRPGMVSVFAQVQNFGPEPEKLDVSLHVNGQRPPGPGSIQEISLGPGTGAATQPSDAPRPGEVGRLPASQDVIFELLHEQGGLVQVKLHHDDALAIDNSAVAPIEPPRQVRVLVVSDRDRVRTLLVRGLKAIGVTEIASLGGKEYETADDKTLLKEGRSAFDLVLLDQHDTERLPPGNYIFFGGLPKLKDLKSGEDVTGQMLVLWQEAHPLIRWVPFSKVYVRKWSRLTLPANAVRLVEGEDSTVMAFITDPGHRYVISAFELEESNFVLEPAFTIFLQNAVMFLASGGLLDTERIVQPGATLSMPVPRGAEELKIRRPDGNRDEVPVKDRTTVTYARTLEVGTYEAEFDDVEKTKEVFAANLLDPIESCIAPVESITIGAEKVTTATGPTKVNEPLWPWLALGALVVLVLEWWIYNRRVMI